MTTIQTDQGETVHAIGAPGSIARVRIEHPKLIERLNALYNSEGNIERGSYNKDSRAFRDTCRELNIKHTYTAINAFIKA